MFFLGATGIQVETGVTTGDWEEAAIKRAFCRGAAEVVLMLSPEKLGAAAAYQIIPVEDLSVLVVGAETEDSALSQLINKGIEVLRAD